MTQIRATAKWNYIKLKNLSVSVHSILDWKFVSQLTLSANTESAKKRNLFWKKNRNYCI